MRRYLLHKVLHGHLVNALGRENDVGSSRQDFLDAFLRECQVNDQSFTVSTLSNIFRVKEKRLRQ